MLKILNRKYPLKAGDWKDALLQALIVFLILYLLKPFGLDQLDRYTRLLLPVCLGYAALTWAAIIAFQKTITKIANRKGNWTILDALVSGVLMWLVMGLVNFGYSVAVFQIDPQHLLRVFFYFVYWTILIGVLLTLVATLVNYNRYLKSELAQMINNTSDEQKDIMLRISDHSVRGESLVIGINDFLYAESMKNDITVWYHADGIVKNTTFRMTMAQLQEQMPYDNIFQCHRSFIINTNNITDAKGNSNGYQLKLGNALGLIPVSRANVPRLKSYLA